MLLKKDVHNAKIKDIEDKIPNITNLAINTILNAKINEIKKEIPSITNLATTTALTAVENKIPDHSKYITTPEFNLTAEHFAARLEQANLPSKNDIANFVKKTDFVDKLKSLNKKITSNKRKHVLVENELNELSEKVKTISTKGLTKDLIINLIFSMDQNISIQEHYKIILHLYQLKNKLNVLVALLGFICRNLMKCQKKILKI